MNILAHILRSPVRKLLPDIVASVVRIAPEKRVELVRLVEQHGIKFKFRNRPGFVFQADPASRTITCSTKGLETLWAAAFTYYVVYQESVKVQRGGAPELDFNLNDRVRQAASLMTWAERNKIDAKTLYWPRSLPHPTRHPECASDVHVANEIFLCAVAWTLWHEMFHIVLNHPVVSPVMLQEERTADARATEWILRDCRDPLMIQKRALGIAVAILVLTSIDLASDTLENSTHPRAYQRLFDSIYDHVPETQELVYCFIVMIMKMYMDRHDIDAGGTVYDSCRECFQGYCLVLRNHQADQQ